MSDYLRFCIGEKFLNPLSDNNVVPDMNTQVQNQVQVNQQEKQDLEKELRNALINTELLFKANTKPVHTEFKTDYTVFGYSREISNGWVEFKIYGEIAGVMINNTGYYFNVRYHGNNGAAYDLHVYVRDGKELSIFMSTAIDPIDNCALTALTYANSRKKPDLSKCDILRPLKQVLSKIGAKLEIDNDYGISYDTITLRIRLTWVK